MIMRATFSPCKSYRYLLEREWAEGPTLSVCMLNPSTADAEKNDRTVSKCIARAQANGFGSLIVVNLYAFRSTDPDILWHRWAVCQEIIGPENNFFITQAARRCSRFMIGWGGTMAKAGRATMPHCRDNRVLELIREVHKKPLLCLGVTNFGFPRHPLYVANSREFSIYENEEYRRVIAG